MKAWLKFKNWLRMWLLKKCKGVPEEQPRISIPLGCQDAQPVTLRVELGPNVTMGDQFRVLQMRTDFLRPLEMQDHNERKRFVTQSSLQVELHISLEQVSP